MGAFGKGLTFSLAGAAVAVSLGRTPSVNAAAVTVGFNDPNDINQFFQNNDGTARTVFNFSSTGGIADQAGGANGGALVAPNPSIDATAVYQSKSVNLTTGQAVVSVLFNFSAATNAARTQLGFLSKPNLSFNGENPPGSAFIAPRVNSDGSVNIQIKPSAAGTATPFNGTLTGGIQGGHWYQLTVGLTETDTALGNVTIDTSVSDLGTTGTGAPTLVFQNSTNITFVDFAGTNFGSLLFTGVRTANATTPQLSLDNFTVSGNLSNAPEPASLALLGIGAGGFLLRRRRAD